MFISRQGNMLKQVLPYTVNQFARALVMPNLKPPVTTTQLAIQYYNEIRSAVPEGAQFEPLMSLYLTDNTTPEEIERAKKSGLVQACKLYPSGATTKF